MHPCCCQQLPPHPPSLPVSLPPGAERAGRLELNHAAGTLLTSCHPLLFLLPPCNTQVLSEQDDWSWNMGNIVHTMTNRRYAEACVVSPP